MLTGGANGQIETFPLFLPQEGLIIGQLSDQASAARGHCDCEIELALQRGNVQACSATLYCYTSVYSDCEITACISSDRRKSGQLP
jgi:hypothetical protein